MNFSWIFRKKSEAKQSEHKEIICETSPPSPEVPKEAIFFRDTSKEIGEKPSNVRAHKLVPHEQMEVAKLLGWFWSPSDIRDYVSEKFKKQVNDANIVWYKYSDKWKPIIAKYRQEYNDSVSDEPLASRKKRLQELGYLYERHKSEDELRDARAVLREAREEMSQRIGDINFHFTQVEHNEFNHLSDEDLKLEKAKALEELEKIRSLKLKLGKEPFEDAAHEKGDEDSKEYAEGVWSQEG